MTTTFDNKTSILADLWIEYKQEEAFLDFIEYNDIGLPLAYLISNNIAKSNKVGDVMIDETWELLLSALGIQEDAGFETLDEILDAATEI